MSTEYAGLLLYLLPAILIIGWYVWRTRLRQAANKTLLEENREAGLLEPPSLHPRIDASQCIGCSACISACPEKNVLGLINNKAQLISPSNCIGHGACQKACPVGAIDLVFGTATRGVDIPVVSPDFESSVPGIFVAGELGGMGLIRNAIEQGKQAVTALRKTLASGHSHDLDVVIVGAGPAGLSASLAAREAGLRYVTLDQESGLGGTVAHFPRGKLVMTQPARLPLAGTLKLLRLSKEQLLSFWQESLLNYPLELRFAEKVVDVKRENGGFRVITERNSFLTRCVLLAIGRRGSPRKLGITGEELNKVVYRLVDPEQFTKQDVMVVGGGDSALEAACTLAEDCEARVSLVYRGEAFGRAKPANRARVQSLVGDGRLEVHLSCSPKEIRVDQVLLATSEREWWVANQAVIICAGGELPTPFLKKVGVDMETRYGT